MLAQDPFTGNLHDVPYPQVPGFGSVLYDGLGNPVGGLFDSLLSPIRSIVGNLPVVGGLFNSLLPGGAPAPPPPPIIAPAAPAYAQPAPYGSTAYVQPPMGGPFSNLFPPRLPFRRCGPPMGWTTSALPYTTAPRRLYLRCSVWPGQAGMVPVNPGQWPQTMAQAGAAGAMMAMRRRRGRRRR